MAGTSTRGWWSPSARGTRSSRGSSLTSTYVEGAGPAGLGRFGYSRDGKPRNRQIVIGVVRMEAWPIARHVFAGNRPDQTTVKEVVQDLNARLDLNRVVFVGDRGRLTIGNVGELRKMQQGYRVGLPRRNRKDASEYIQQAEARTDWQDCPAGIRASEKAVPPKIRVVEVAGKEPGVRVFGVHSDEREQSERAMRELSMERAREKALEGKYVIQSEERNLSAIEAYKQLNEVERGF